MSASRQRQSHDAIARLGERQKHALIGLRARMRLNIGEGAIEEFLRPVDRQLFHHVHELAAAIVSAPRITFGILVGEHRALRLHRGQGYDVLGCDEFDLVLLPAQFVANSRREFRIRLAQCGGEKAVRHWSAPSRLVKTAKLIAGRMRQTTARPEAMVVGIRAMSSFVRAAGEIRRETTIYRRELKRNHQVWRVT
jgi:hypothetical protein